MSLHILARRRRAEVLVNAVLNELRSRSNYCVDIVLHGSLDSDDRGERLDIEDELYRVVETVLKMEEMTT